MAKKKRKSDRCLNCGAHLDHSFEYCPHCGQENDDRQMSFGRLFVDFFSNYFSLDSKFGRSIKPFFLQPGMLTREFMEGRRMKYANPIRLYLVVSLIHFFLFSLTMDKKASKNDGIIKSSPVQIDSKSDSTEVEEEPLPIITSLDELDTLETSENSSFFISGSDWKTIAGMTKKDGLRYTVEQIEDSIKNERKKPIPRYLTSKLIKLMNSELHSINMYIVGKIPGVMFFLLPFYALLLKIFFSKRLYINHIVHSLHIHSFTFTMLSVLWIINLISETFSDKIAVVFPIVLLIYIILSFKNTYRISYKTAIWKVLLTGLIYANIVSIGLVFGVIISLLLY
jgi:hypothetical protein